MEAVTSSAVPVHSLPEKDARAFCTWKVKQAPQFDRDIISYPRTVILYAEQAGEVIAMAPVQPVLFIGCFLFDPSATPEVYEASLKALGVTLAEIARDTQFRECYFITENLDFANFCVRSGWKRVIGNEPGRFERVLSLFRPQPKGKFLLQCKFDSEGTVCA